MNGDEREIIVHRKGATPALSAFLDGANLQSLMRSSDPLTPRRPSPF